MKKTALANKVLWGLARECDFAKLGKDEVLAIKGDSDAVHHRFIERELKALDDRSFEHDGSSEHKDAMEDIIRVPGWDTTRLKLGKVPLLWSHDAYPGPMGNVGKAVKGKAADGVKALITTSRVHDAEMFGDTEFGKHVEFILRLMQAGEMPGVSVGFVPKEVRWPEPDEREALGMGPWGVIYEKQELLELSVTPIPANSHAQQRKSLDTFGANLKKFVDAGEMSAEFAASLCKALAPMEEEFLAARGLKERTIVPIEFELPWLRGGKPEKSAPEQIDTADSLRALINSELSSVIRSHTSEITAASLAISQKVDALQVSIDELQKGASESGVNEQGGTSRQPLTTGTTSKTRESDPVAFQRELLSGVIDALKSAG